MVRRVRNSVLLLALVALAMLPVSSAPPEPGSAQAPQRPNIVFVYTDDQDTETFRREVMPKTFRNLVDQGVTFENMITSTALCCPTRVTYLRGQYSHNHRVFSNYYPSGGYQKFRQMGYRSRQLPVWLKGSGYATAHVGRVMNGYSDFLPEIPRGWDTWVALAKEWGRQWYQINDNGKLYTKARAAEQDVDQLSRKAVGFVKSRAPSEKPFYLQVSTFQPHLPYFYPKRYADKYASEEAPKPPSFNEANVSDKPSHIQKRSRLSGDQIAQLNEDYRKRLRGLRGVDDLISDLVVALKKAGEFQNTVFIFSSDNGYELGTRRATEGKIDPYEESINIPLVMRGPGIRKGMVQKRLASTNDIVPTIMDFAGAKEKPFFDGRSLKPLVDSKPTSTWRTAVGIEYLPTIDEGDIGYIPFYGVRTAGGEKYVYYPSTGEKEYYNLNSDPYELRNEASKPANADRVAALAEKARQIRSCSGSSCRAAERGR
jgi:N-acetylglucosamine-6-sulfatase